MVVRVLQIIMTKSISMDQINTAKSRPDLYAKRFCKLLYQLTGPSARQKCHSRPMICITQYTPTNTDRNNIMLQCLSVTKSLYLFTGLP